ncbi:acid protease [Pleurotus eryngii]|uniref:Acid protease n=1 Tax=Pleurotus eryngii TaxID=5323 RepID=A0A9P6DJD9_PLEER|nr:acid protease [Pleurotus eryngii]
MRSQENSGHLWDAKCLLERLIYPYTGNITIGGQNVIVNLDTGSADLWAYLPDQRPRLINSTSIVGNVAYAIGSAEGPINFAALEFAGFSVPSQAFIDVAQTVDMDAIFNNGASGLLGLGFDATNSIINDNFEEAFGDATTLGRSPIVNIFYQNMTLPNFFTLLLGRTDDPDDERAGVFTISEYVSEFSAVGETPKLTSQTIAHWSVLVNGVKVSGQSLPLNSSVATVSQGKAVAVLDSGFSLPPIPSAWVDAIYGAIPGSARVSDIPALADSPIEWIVPCNQSTEVSFSIGGRDFPIHPIDLTKIGTIPINGTNVTFCTNTYQSIKIGHGEFDMILGDAFLKNAYVSFDYGSFDDQGHLTEPPFIQLLPTTDSKEAWAEFIAIRAKALEGTVELAPSELRIWAMQDNTDDHPDAPIDEASEISGVLAASDDTNHIGGAAADTIQKYAPIASTSVYRKVVVTESPLRPIIIL